MRPKTKHQLNFIFGLGLITAALSIARACTVTKKSLTEDATCKAPCSSILSLTAKDPKGNEIPFYYICGFETSLGIIIACGPALRQFWAYKKRTQTILPTKYRQYPDEDFEKMRYRIHLRDVFWYRRAVSVGNRVFDATPIFRSSSPPPDASSSQVKTSILDAWEQQIKKVPSVRYNDNVYSL